MFMTSSSDSFTVLSEWQDSALYANENSLDMIIHNSSFVDTAKSKYNSPATKSQFAFLEILVDTFHDSFSLNAAKRKELVVLSPSFPTA